MASLKLYYDLMSQPCRALYIFFKCAGIPYEDVIIALRKNEQHKPDFVALNPFRKVPVLVEEKKDSKFVLRESCVISRYVSNNYLPPSSHWFPRDDIVKNIKIDEYLHWQHFNTRTNGAMVFLNAVAFPMMTKQPPDFNKVHRFKKELDKSCDLFEAAFLNAAPFIAGDEMSVADLFAVCELMQPLAAGFDVSASRPRLAAWMREVTTNTQPHFDHAHQVVRNVADMVGDGVQEAYAEFLEEKQSQTSA